MSFLLKLMLALMVGSALPAQAALVPCDGLKCTVNDLLQLFVGIYNWLIGISALVVMLILIIGGIRMLYWSFMEDKPGELKGAQQTVTHAITGLAIILLAYLIVNTVFSFLGACGSSNTGIWCTLLS